MPLLPSEHIGEIKRELIMMDYYRSSGLTEERWLENHKEDPSYTCKAIIQYLDNLLPNLI